MRKTNFFYFPKDVVVCGGGGVRQRFTQIRQIRKAEDRTILEFTYRAGEGRGE